MYVLHWSARFNYFSQRNKKKNYKDDLLFLEKQHVLPFPILSTLGRLCEYDFRALAAIYNKNTVHVTVTDGFP